MLVGTFAAAPSRAGASPQAAVASEFLARLESGRHDQARLLLDSATLRSVGIQAVAANAPRYDKTLIRRIAYEGAISMAAAHARRPAQYYVVCYVDLPRAHYGMVRHIGVVLLQEPGGWRVSDYRYQSVPHPACAGHV
jgi:hypothetical protein